MNKNYIYDFSQTAPQSAKIRAVHIYFLSTVWQWENVVRLSLRTKG